MRAVAHTSSSCDTAAGLFPSRITTALHGVYPGPDRSPRAAKVGVHRGWEVRDQERWGPGVRGCGKPDGQPSALS